MTKSQEISVREEEISHYNKIMKLNLGPFLSFGIMWSFRLTEDEAFSIIDARILKLGNEIKVIKETIQ